MKKSRKAFLLAIEAYWWSVVSNFSNIVRYNKIYSKDKILGRKLYHYQKQILAEEKRESNELIQICIKKNFHTIQIKEIWSSRIGEFLGRVVMELEEVKANSAKGIWSVFIWGHSHPCNKVLFKMIERYVTVITPQRLNVWMEFLKNTDIKFVFQKKESYRIASKYYEREIGIPYFDFSEEEKLVGEQKLIDMGIQGEYVCIFTRDSSYLSTTFSTRDFTYHNYRDSDINKFIAAIDFLKDNELRTIRMGQIVEKKIEIENCLDFSSNYYSEFMDLYLFSKCKFFVGDNAGINFLPMIFSRPTAITNVIWGFTPSFGGWQNSKDDLFIVKKYFKVSENRMLTFIEMFELDNEIAIAENCYEKVGIEIIDNTKEEIKDLTEEMLRKLNGTWIEDARDKERQQLWKSQLECFYKEHDLNFFDAVQQNMGDTFLRKNPELFGQKMKTQVKGE